MNHLNDNFLFGGGRGGAHHGKENPVSIHLQIFITALKPICNGTLTQTKRNIYFEIRRYDIRIKVNWQLSEGASADHSHMTV